VKKTELARSAETLIPTKSHFSKRLFSGLQKIKLGRQINPGESNAQALSIN
jgi:hypothetical protein